MSNLQLGIDIPGRYEPILKNLTAKITHNALSPLLLSCPCKLIAENLNTVINSLSILHIITHNTKIKLNRSTLKPYTCIYLTVISTRIRHYYLRVHDPA